LTVTWLSTRRATYAVDPTCSVGLVAAAHPPVALIILSVNVC
jgi:hypothetical protein